MLKCKEFLNYTYEIPYKEIDPKITDVIKVYDIESIDKTEHPSWVKSKINEMLKDAETVYDNNKVPHKRCTVNTVTSTPEKELNEFFKTNMGVKVVSVNYQKNFDNNDHHSNRGSYSVFMVYEDHLTE